MVNHFLWLPNKRKWPYGDDQRTRVSVIRLKLIRVVHAIHLMFASKYLDLSINNWRSVKFTDLSKDRFYCDEWVKNRHSCGLAKYYTKWDKREVGIYSLKKSNTFSFYIRNNKLTHLLGILKTPHTSFIHKGKK